VGLHQTLRMNHRSAAFAAAAPGLGAVAPFVGCKAQKPIQPAGAS
jgi:hypothetical protein